MLRAADSLTTSGPSTAAPAAFPGWARPKNPPESVAEAAFLAGAALGRLDAVVRENPPWAGVFRRRLALAAAAASVRRAGRAEDEARLRDALHLRRPGDDAGPAGRRLMAWRALTARSAGLWPQSVEAAAEVVGVKHDDALLEHRSRRGLRRRRSAGAVRRRRGGRDDATDPSLCAADFRVGCRTRRALARRRCVGAAPEMAVRAAFARRASLPGQRAARGARRRRRGRKLGLRLLPRLRPRRRAGLRSLGRFGAAGEKAARGRAKTARQRGGRRAAGVARRRFAQRGHKNRRANVGARRATAVRPPRRARRDPRTDGTVDVPALRAMGRWRGPENPQASWIRNSRTCPRPRAGANGWVASRRSSSPPPSRSRAKISPAWSARPATSS